MPDSTEESEETTEGVRLERAAEGDQDALSGLISDLSALLLGQARSRISSTLRRHVDEDDVVQDAWAIVLPQLKILLNRGIDTESRLLGFLGRVLLYRLSNLMRRLTKHPQLNGAVLDSMASLDAATSGVVGNLARKERALSAFEALDALDPVDQSLVLMRVCEGAGFREIATVVGLAENTATQRCRRALERLATILPDEIRSSYLNS